MPLDISSAFFERLQNDDVGELVELIDLATPNGTFHWTTRNEPLLASFSGSPLMYDPFPGDASPAGARNTELAVAAARFAVANSGSILQDILQGQELMRTSIRIRRVFADTPGLDEWHLFEGTIQDIQHSRDIVSGQVRDKMSFVARAFPPYAYQDKCIWRFGSQGCGIDVSSFTETVSPAQLVVGSSSKLALYVDSYTGGRDDDFYSLGRATCVFGSNSGSIRQVRVHTGAVVGLSHPLPAAPGASDVWELQAGCRKRLITDCHSKFSNVNTGQTFGFAGFPWIPVQDNAY